MKNVFFFSLVLSALFLSPNPINAQCSSSAKAVKVSNHHDTQKDVVDIALGSKDHTTLVAAIKAADLVSTLKSDGPFTVFAPTNSAFDALPEGTVANLLKPENKKTLATILTYHVVAGNIDSKAVVQAIQDGKGKASLTTVSGGKLQAMIVNDQVMLKDENGNLAGVTAVDLKGNNGVVHVIDKVVLPK